MKRVGLFVVLGLLALASVVQAQIVTGNVIGTVKDDSGAVLPGVTVTLEMAGRPALTSVTTATGEYRFVQVEAGTYTLTATLTGFSTYTEQGLIVSVGGTTARDVTLKLGQVSESI